LLLKHGSFSNKMSVETRKAVAFSWSVGGCICLKKCIFKAYNHDAKLCIGMSHLYVAGVQCVAEAYGDLQMQVSQETAAKAAEVVKRRPNIISILCDDGEWSGTEGTDDANVVRTFEIGALEWALIETLDSTECPYCSRFNNAEKSALYFHEGGLGPLTHATCGQCGKEYTNISGF